MSIGILALCFAVLAIPFFILGMKETEKKIDVKPTDYHGNYYSINEL